MSLDVDRVKPSVRRAEAGSSRPRVISRVALVWVGGVSTVVFVAATFMARSPTPGSWELTVFEAVNGLPDWLYYVIWPFMQYGVFVTIPIAAVVAVALKRHRLGVMLACSGVSIYLLAKLVKDVAQRGRPDAFLDTVIEREHFARSSLGYTSGHVAVAATIATLTFFHLPKRLQRVTIALVGIVAFGRMYVGAHLPLDMIGALAMGVAAGCFVTYLFGTAAAPRRDHHRIGRHPGDVARLVFGISLLGVAALAVQRTRLTVFEANLFRLVNDLPQAMSGWLVAVMQAGNLFAGPVIAVVVLIAVRRWRPALDLLAAGPAAWVAAKLIKDIAQRPRPSGLLEDIGRPGSVGLGFISGHTAVAAALVTAAAPFLPRRWRRVAWALPWIVGIARIYEGAHLPLDIVGGVAAGWAVGAVLHLAFGAPHRVPSVGDARNVLENAGWTVTDITPIAGDPRGSFPFVATTAGEGPVFVKLLDPEPRDADWVFRIARFLAVRDVRDEAAMPDPDARADHEAAMTLLARCHGARVPVTRRIEQSGRRRWLVQEFIAGETLSSREGSAVDDELLRNAWRETKRLHSAQLAHRDLVGSNLVIDENEQVWLVDFAHALSGARPRALDNDIAELLVSTALVVGVERAVDAAASVLGTEALRPALTELQPLTLTAENRERLGADPGLLPDLRTAVARTAGIATEGDRVIDRPKRRGPIAAAVGLVTVAALVATAPAPEIVRQLQSPGYRWLGLAALSAALLAIASGATQAAATDRRLGLGRTALARLVSTAAAPIEGKRAAAASLAAHLERLGVPRAALGTRRLAWARIAAHGVVLVGAVAVASHHSTGLDTPDKAWMLAAIAGASVVGQTVVVMTTGRVKAQPTAREPRPDVPAVLASSALVEVLLGATCAVAAASAFGPAPAIAVVVALYITSAGVAAVLPAGGAGTVEVLLSVGFAATGMTLAGAVTAAVVLRVLVFWLPLAVGRLIGPALTRRLVI